MRACDSEAEVGVSAEQERQAAAVCEQEDPHRSVNSAEAAAASLPQNVLRTAHKLHREI